MRRWIPRNLQLSAPSLMSDLPHNQQLDNPLCTRCVSTSSRHRLHLQPMRRRLQHPSRRSRWRWRHSGPPARVRTQEKLVTRLDTHGHRPSRRPHVTVVDLAHPQRRTVWLMAAIRVLLQAPSSWEEVHSAPTMLTVCLRTCLVSAGPNAHLRRMRPCLLRPWKLSYRMPWTLCSWSPNAL